MFASGLLEQSGFGERLFFHCNRPLQAGVIPDERRLTPALRFAFYAFSGIVGICAMLPRKSGRPAMGGFFASELRREEGQFTLRHASAELLPVIRW